MQCKRRGPGWLLMALACLAACTGLAAEEQGPVRLGTHRGAPALVLGSGAEFPMFHFSQEVPDDYARGFREAGFRFYACIEETSFLDLGWTGPYQFSFSKLDKVMTGFQRRLPDCYVMPKVHLWAPQWWVETHPSEQVGLLVVPEAQGYTVGSGPKHESFASPLWQAEAGEGLRQVVRHVLQAPYADRVMGIMLAGGTYGEWHPWASEGIPDTSEPMRQAFVRFARAKYHDDEQELRQAWRDPGATFAGVRIPDRARRQTPRWGCSAIRRWDGVSWTTTSASMG